MQVTRRHRLAPVLLFVQSIRFATRRILDNALSSLEVCPVKILKLFETTNFTTSCLVLCLATVTGCATDRATDATASSIDPIQGGKLETGYPAIGQVLLGNG